MRVILGRLVVLLLVATGCGRVGFDVHTSSDSSCANGVIDGLEDGIDCGGECWPCDHRFVAPFDGKIFSPPSESKIRY